MRRVLLVMLLMLPSARVRAEVEVGRLLALAQSERSRDHRLLARQLARRPVRTALNRDIEHRRPAPSKCGIGAPPYSALDACAGKRAEQGAPGIVCALARNATPSARTLFARLPQLGFQVDTELGDLWLEASAQMRPPDPRVVRIWRRWWRGPYGAANLMSSVLLDNGSPAAFRLFVQHALRTKDESDLTFLIGFQLRARRDRAPILRLARQLMRRLPKQRVIILQAIFTEALNGTAGHHTLPFPQTPAATQRAMKQLAADALRTKLPAGLRRQIEQTVAACAL